MSFKKVILVLSVIVSLGLTQNALSENKEPVVSEGPFLEVYISKDLTGYIQTRKCEKCSPFNIKITPDVKVFIRNKKDSLSSFIRTSIKPVYVMYDAEQKKALTIGWLKK